MARRNRLLDLLRRRRHSVEIEREISFHLAECVDDLMAQGMSRSDALREAHRRFGHPSFPRERAARGDMLTWIQSVLADLRYAARSLRRSPGFTLVAVLSLGLGIGANTAIFSLYNALALRPLPVRNPEELVQITFGDGRTVFTNPLWEEFRERQGVMSEAFAYGPARFGLTEGGEVRTSPGYWVSGEFFPVLGVRPVLGRLLTGSDDYRGCPAVAVVSHGFWQRELGGSSDAVGGILRLSGTPFEVVGVVDPGFSGVDVGSVTDVYAPICAQEILFPGWGRLTGRSNWYLFVLGRLGPGLTLDETGLRLGALSSGVFGATVPELWGPEDQAEYRAYTFSLRAAPNGVSRLREQYSYALKVLMAVVGVVLLIACGNLAHLLLARATRRQHEVAIRRAIGSGRGRLVRLLVTESLLLLLVSVIVAVFFADWASGFLVGMLSSDGSLWLDLSLDIRVLGFTLAISTATALVFGLAPAWQATGTAPQMALRRAGRRPAEQRRLFATGKLLVIGQFSLSLFLVVGAGLLIGTLTRLQTVDTGFNRDNMLVVSIDKRGAGYSAEESLRVNQELLTQMRALPGVRWASASNMIPIGSGAWNNYVEVDGYTPASREETLTWLQAITDGYFETFETPLLAGRDFDSRDSRESVQVAIINETMARKFFRGIQPIGRRFRRITGSQESLEYEVIGVVEDTKYESVDQETVPIAFLPLSQMPTTFGVSLLYEIRTEGAPMAMAPAVASLIEQESDRILYRFSTLSDLVSSSLTRPRVLAVLSGFFGTIALLLAMIGLYGTLAYQVSSRRNEMGVRLALGAARGQVLRMVLGEVGRLVIVGISIGLAVTIVGTRFLASFLFGLTATDPRTLILSAALLAGVALAAGALPAWHAARLDPVETLKEE